MTTRSLKDLFHLVGRVLPEEQELVSLDPSDTVEKAFSIMLERNLSQLPVLHKSELLGIFSFRSFAQNLLLLKTITSPLVLPVEDFLEELYIAHTDSVLTELLEEFNRKDAVLMGSREMVQGVVTTVDALNYFYQIANGYVLLGEIELAIRELIRQSVSEQELQDCIVNALVPTYRHKNQQPPNALEEFTMSDYVQIVRFKGHWDKFKSAFGGTSDTTYTRLKPLPNLRNEVFHFRRELTVEEYDSLRDARDWLHRRIRKTNADLLGRINEEY